MNTRGVGWGLTLNWSLPMLRSLLRPELLSRFAETYVDRQGIASGLVPRFPFYDLSTGELKATTPPLPETVRVRVTRERLRKWLATDVDIEVRRFMLTRTMLPGIAQQCCTRSADIHAFGWPTSL